MTETEFFYWLAGAYELGDLRVLSDYQARHIQTKIKSVRENTPTLSPQCEAVNTLAGVLRPDRAEVFNAKGEAMTDPVALTATRQIREQTIDFFAVLRDKRIVEQELRDAIDAENAAPSEPE
jgi:hypothetical protein